MIEYLIYIWLVINTVITVSIYYKLLIKNIKLKNENQLLNEAMLDLMSDFNLNEYKSTRFKFQRKENKNDD